MGERIILRLPQGSSRALAKQAVELAWDFTTQFIDRPHGERRGVVYSCAGTSGTFHALVYWTKARAVVVRVFPAADTGGAQ